ncbi:hypothetical protein TWF281_006934 [Arthrobotrys megalospora]
MSDTSFPYSWSGMLELGRSSYQACLSHKDKASDVMLEECQCTTKNCRDDDGINHPTLPFRWNFRGSVNLNKRGSMRPSFFTGYIQNSETKLCMTWKYPVDRPVPPNPDHKIGDIFMSPCGQNETGTLQQFSTWLFDGKPMSQIMPTDKTHFTPSCNNNKDKKSFYWRGLIGIKGKAIYYGCWDWDKTQWNYHPWFYRVPAEQAYWPSDRYLDDMSDRLGDFDFDKPEEKPPPEPTPTPAPNPPPEDKEDQKPEDQKPEDQPPEDQPPVDQPPVDQLPEDQKPEGENEEGPP